MINKKKEVNKFMRMKKTTIKLLILEIIEILRELYIKKFFITIFLYTVKLLDQLKKILIILVMYIILFICTYRRYLVKPIIFIKKSLRPLTQQFELNNVISKLDSTTRNLITEIYKNKNKEEIKSLDSIDDITLNLLFALSNSTGVLKQKIENRKFISAIGAKTIYEHLCTFKKEDLPLKFKLKKKICEFIDEEARPYQYIQDETKRHEIDYGFFVGINCSLKDFPLKLDFSELNVYVSIPVSNSKSIIIFRYGLFFKKVVKKVKKLIRKTSTNSTKDNFSSLSFRFFETNNNNDKLHKKNLCLILLKINNLELIYKKQYNYIINYIIDNTTSNINLVENKNISLIKINFIENIINDICNYTTTLYELKELYKVYKNKIKKKKEEFNLYAKNYKKYIEIYKECINYYNTYGTLFPYLDSDNNPIVNLFFTYNWIFQSNFYRIINFIPTLINEFCLYITISSYNALIKLYSYTTSKLYSYITKTNKYELVYKDKNDISVSKINLVNIKYLQSKRLTNINIKKKEKKIISFSPYTSYNLIKYNDITLVYYFLLQNSNFAKISDYNKYLINLKFNNNKNNYKYFIEIFINFNKRYLKRKNRINLKNLLQNLLVNNTNYELNSCKKYKETELSKIKQKYIFNIDFENHISLQLEKANYKYIYDYISTDDNLIYDYDSCPINNNYFKNIEQKNVEHIYSLYTHPKYIDNNVKNNLIKKDTNYLEKEIIKNKNIIEKIIKNQTILYYLNFFNLNNHNFLKKDLCNLYKLIYKNIISLYNINKIKIYFFILFFYQTICNKCYILLYKILYNIYVWIYNQEKNKIIFFAQLKLTKNINIIQKIIKNTLIKSKELSMLSLEKMITPKKNYSFFPIQIEYTVIFIIIPILLYIFTIIFNLNQLYEQTKILNYLVLPSYIQETHMLYAHTKENFFQRYNNILIDIIKTFISFVKSLLEYHNIFKYRNIIHIKEEFIILFSSISCNLISLIKNFVNQINFYKYATYFSYQSKYLYLYFFDQKKIQTRKGYLYNNIENWIDNSFLINDKERKFIIQYTTINKHKKLNNLLQKKYEQPGYKYLCNLVNKKYNYDYNTKLEERPIFLANNYINLYPNNTTNKRNFFPFSLSFIDKHNVLVIDNENEDFVLIKNNIIKNSCIPFVTLTTSYEDMISKFETPFPNFRAFKKRKIKKNTISYIDKNNKVFKKFVHGDDILDNLILNNLNDKTFDLFFQLELINAISPCIVWIPNIHEYNMNLDLYEKKTFNYFALLNLVNIISYNYNENKQTIFIASTLNLKKTDPIFIKPNCLNKCLLLRKPTNILDQRKYFFTLLKSKGFYLENIITINNNLVNSKGIRDIFTLSNETILLSIINKNNNIINDNIIQFSRHKQFHTYVNITKTPLNFTLYQIGQAFIQIILNYSPLSDPLSIYTNFLTKDYFYRHYFSLCTNITRINLCFYIFKCYAGFIINKMWYSLEKYNLVLTCKSTSNITDFNLFYALLQIEKTILLNNFDSSNNNYELDTLVNYAPKDWSNFFLFEFEKELKKDLFKDESLSLYKKGTTPSFINHNWYSIHKEKYFFEDLNKNKIDLYKNNIYNDEYYYYSFVNEVVCYLYSLIYENKYIFEKIMLVLSEKGWIFPEEIKTILLDFIIKKI
uniref:Uncharacterized protein n=2 Tax=Hydnora visseri TaxID=1329980 RepID=A0A0X9MDB1_HYDVS|nr:hypothetical protein RF2 [Hydnora visseri]ALZ49993.1 hypothetical protein RF2 [Hydnora visseri]